MLLLLLLLFLCIFAESGYMNVILDASIHAEEQITFFEHLLFVYQACCLEILKFKHYNLPGTANTELQWDT